ncbi:Phosphate import ATP-binding protein PstB 3 [Roseivivax sp. THAF40]|uniref:ATP-binding cassette domain-containing protein n=1 Tax=unclassified Roseivivax TaxID=2639302 RepID=UPI001267AFC7|nr:MULTISPECIES: ATP-binding cassette domain-containing protein [unclassified Roseivivax]QFS84140.1 Phosphate import ATP-binding protein PstB 3 [Roseivivax sp. THAF197b]QFT47967.1 Phosphate import ATP-binding protein PstB 3 [Roseivivax sp. THAF40]
MRDFMHPDTAPTPRLTLRDVSVRIDGHAVLDGVAAGVPQRGITTILGPNGAGKSMLLRAIHGLIPHDGRIDWADRPAPKQALVFQKPVLLRRSVAANMDFVLGRDRARRDALLAEMGLLGHAKQPARRLSGGEQQRLALARALATDPELLLLDEPTASLDPASAAMIEEVLRRVAARGTTILMVTHDIAQARRIADHALVMCRGRIAEAGAAMRVLAAPRTAIARDFLEGRLVP